MLIISHRGYHVSLPENTLPAFAAAVALGVNGIETDLRLSIDGQIVLYHDHLAPNGQAISDVTHAELSRLAGYDVPTAESALEEFPNLLWNLEIKVPAVLEQASDLIARYGASRRLIITSFWHNVVDEIAERFPHAGQVECGLLVAHRPRRLFTDNPRVRSTVWYYETLDPVLLAEAQALGLKNFVYGVTTRAEHLRCRQLGLEGVITDRPEYCAIAAGDT